MQVVVLPFLGWGLFGASQTPRIAVATLVLHLVYGATYGWLMDRPGGAVSDGPGAQVRDEGHGRTLHHDEG